MNFKIGDKVKFEIAKGKNYSRWSHVDGKDIGIDGGASNVWADGIVVDVLTYKPNASLQDVEILDLHWTIVQYTIKGMIGAGYEMFPKEGNYYYSPNQWNLPGFLTHKEQPAVCECGCEKYYGPSASIHSTWCPKKEKKI